MTNTNQIEIFESAGNLIAGVRSLADGTRVTLKRTGAAGTVKSSNATDYAETMYEIALDNGGTAIMKRGEIHDAHRLSWSCTCSVCVEARKTLGRMWKGA